MRLSQAPSSLLSLLLLLSSTSPHNLLGVSAAPFAKDLSTSNSTDLEDAGFHVFVTTWVQTKVNTASASAFQDLKQRDGGGNVFTTTWTETNTYTSTLTSWAANPTQNCVPQEGWEACGVVCCISGRQYCAHPGQCLDNDSGAGGGGGGTFTRTITSGGATIVTTGFSAPSRPTGGAQTNSGDLGSATSTSSSNGTAVGAGGTANGLSPGAIAGIVIGTIAGVIILLLICMCLLCKGAWNALVALLGGGKKRREHSKERVEVVEERYGRSHSRRPSHAGWYSSGGPSTVADSRRADKKKKSGGGWLGLAGAAGTLLLLLGLKRDKNKSKGGSSHKPPRSDYSSTYYTDSYTGSSLSSLSSDRRTRDTRASRHTRTTRYTQSRAPSHSRAPSRR